MTDPEGCEGADNNAGGGQTCDAEPFCSGDLILCNVLAQQWRTRCAVDQLTAEHEPTTDGSTGATDDDVIGVRDVDTSGLLSGVDSTAFLGSGSCPLLPSFSAFGASYSFSDWSGWCIFLQALGGIVYFMGGFFAVRILLGG